MFTLMGLAIGLGEDEELPGAEEDEAASTASSEKSKPGSKAEQVEAEVVDPNDPWNK